MTLKPQLPSVIRAFVTVNQSFAFFKKKLSMLFMYTVAIFCIYLVFAPRNEISLVLSSFLKVIYKI